MPSFDVVSEVDKHELNNAVDQTNREVNNRFDFKGTNSRIEQNEYELIIIAPSEFQIKQIRDIFHNKMGKRGIDVGCLEEGSLTEAHNEARLPLTVKHGLDKDISKKLVKIIKDSKLKVQASIQGEQVRISGKKKDDLQQVITILKAANLTIPLQYINFRD